jgi:hypothetical protein
MGRCSTSAPTTRATAPMPPSCPRCKATGAHCSPTWVWPKTRPMKWSPLCSRTQKERPSSPSPAGGPATS